MNGIIDMLRMLYHRNKFLFIAVVLVVALFIVGCSSQGSSPPPTGPVGGGC